MGRLFGWFFGWYFKLMMSLFHALANLLQTWSTNWRNKQSRGLLQYYSITPDDVLPEESFKENIIISGGTCEDRLKLSTKALHNCFINHHPVIVLHTGNRELENIIVSNNWGTVINQHNKIFDAFTSFRIGEICETVLNTCRSKYDIKPEGSYILQIVYKLLDSKRMHPFFYNYAKCPFLRLHDKINEYLKQGLITQADAMNLNSLLMAGQNEIPKIDNFFRDMQLQLSYIAADNVNNAGGVSILSVLKRKKILCIDLRPSNDPMFLELLMNSLAVAMKRGYEFSFLLDDIAVAGNEALKNILCQKSSHNNIICSKDLYALLGARDDVFSTLTGVADKTILFSHASQLSCEKWSKFIGEYDKMDASYTRNAGWNHSFRAGFGVNNGRTFAKKREYIVKPEQLNRLLQGGLIVYDNDTGSLVQSVLT